ncbi:unnamed protein product [Amoebophrya sp. A120]|nr:unnamed protein product [Amoebophrya sp. A120]|eukprot:GSA120T00001879001.1
MQTHAPRRQNRCNALRLCPSRSRRGQGRSRSRAEDPLLTPASAVPPAPGGGEDYQRHDARRTNYFEFDVPENMDLIFASFPGHPFPTYDDQIPKAAEYSRYLGHLKTSMVTLQSLEKVAATSAMPMKKKGKEEAPPEGTARSTTSTSTAAMAESIAKALNDGYSLAGRGKGSARLFRNTHVIFAAKFVEQRNFPHLKKFLQLSTGLSADGDEKSKSWAWHVASKRQGNQLMQIRADETKSCVYTWKRLQASGKIVPVQFIGVRRGRCCSSESKGHFHEGCQVIPVHSSRRASMGGRRPWFKPL